MDVKATKCETCLKEYDHWAGLSRHVSRGYILRCEKCDRIFTKESGLKSHLRKKIPCDTRVRECERCGRKFATLGDMTKHLMSKKLCIPKGHISQTCHCGRIFKRDADYLKHLRMQKTPCRSSYDCPCGKSFGTKVKLFWHCTTCVHDYEDIML